MDPVCPRDVFRSLAHKPELLRKVDYGHIHIRIVFDAFGSPPAGISADIDYVARLESEDDLQGAVK